MVLDALFAGQSSPFFPPPGECENKFLQFLQSSEVVDRDITHVFCMHHTGGLDFLHKLHTLQRRRHLLTLLPWKTVVIDESMVYPKFYKEAKALFQSSLHFSFTSSDRTTPESLATCIVANPKIWAEKKKNFGNQKRYNVYNVSSMWSACKSVNAGRKDTGSLAFVPAQGKQIQDASLTKKYKINYSRHPDARDNALWNDHMLGLLHRFTGKQNLKMEIRYINTHSKQNLLCSPHSKQT